MTDLLSRVNPGVRGLQPYQPGKPIDELEREYGVKDALKLASNENPLGPSPLALEAARHALGEVWLYPDGNGFRLKRKIAARHGVPMEWITLGSGSSEPLDFVVRLFVSPQSEVLFSAHSFALYPILTQMAGARGIAVPARSWGCDLEAMLAAVTGRTAVIFIANPNNPTGTWLEGASLEAFLRQLPERVMVVIDEAYFEYANHPATGAEGYPDTSGWVTRYPNLVVTRTFSKCYGLAGLRVGYAISRPEVAELMNRVRPPFNVTSVALAAAEAALEDEEHRRRSVESNAAGLEQLAAGFRRLGLEYIPSAGNFICVDVGRDAAPVYEALLREGVIVRPVANYGMPRHLRITVGKPEHNDIIISSLEKVLQR